MIRVAKGPVPAVLAGAGAAATAADRLAFDADPAAYLSGAKEMSIARGIYAHDDIRAQLGADQHGKCCYCEVEIEVPYMERDVEHWRPKGAVKDLNGSAKLYPGYYWLAYDWTNLYLACNVCNRLKKKEQFPLGPGGVRARSHLDDLALELPLLLRPDGPEDPELHIEYVEDQPRHLSPQGEATIRVAGLQRLRDKKRNGQMVLLRRARTRLLRHLGEDSPSARLTVREAREELEQAIRPEAPFSSMARAFLRDNPVPAP